MNKRSPKNPSPFKNIWEGMRAFTYDLSELPRIFRQKDPAARSTWEVLLCYPGVKAILNHRMAHSFWLNGWTTAARAISEWGRFLTGIEIHPGAQVGRRVMIDHGMGVVIGETTEIENDVLIYQNVTLGGTALSPTKRHPTLRAGCVIGVGASVLGPIEVGAGAKVGAGAVVVKSVAANSSVTGIPAQPVRAHRAFTPHLSAVHAAAPSAPQTATQPQEKT